MIQIHHPRHANLQGNKPKVRKFTERLWAQLAETVGVSPQTPLAGSEEGAGGAGGRYDIKFKTMACLLFCKTLLKVNES